MKRIIPGFLLTVLLFSGCSTSNVQVDSKSTGQDVSAPQDIYIMAGRVTAKDKADVASKISGRVSKITVDVGTRVNKGDPIIYLDTADIQAQVNQAEAGVGTAQANLNRTLSGARQEQVAQAQASVDSAKVTYENEKSNYDRMKNLFDSGSISQQQLEAEQSKYTAAEAQFKAAQEQLDILNNGETKETVDVVKSQVQQAQATLDVAKTQLSNGTILAPVSGIVSAKNINEGEMVSPGVTLVSIVNSDNLYVNAYLPSGFVGQVKSGQQVTVKISEIPDKKFDGEITVINSIVDSISKNVLVKVSLKDPDSVLKPGMFAEIGLKK